MNHSVSQSLRSCALALSCAFAAGVVPAAQPDALGITIGMSAADAYNALKVADAGHRVKVDQMRIPELLGGKAAVYLMSPDTQTSNDNAWVNITLPPNPQQVWEVHHQIGDIHVTREQAEASLLSKYGANPRSRSAGVYLWFYDEQGNLLNLSQSDFSNCSQTIGPLDVLGAAVNGSASGTTRSSTQSDVQMRQVPHLWDPSTFPQCQHVVWVQATLVGSGLIWQITVTISDYGLQHRSSAALIAFLNNLATQQQNKEINQAERTAVPKL